MFTFGPAALIAALAATFTATAGPAAASCVGPMLESNSGPAGPGAVVMVRGRYFGDQCYDTGIPSGAHGGLGDPILTITLYVVQDGVDHVVARGSADDGYAFQVDIELPATLHAGPAQLVASTPNPRTTRLRPVELVIADEEPRATSGVIATLRPVTLAVPEPRPSVGAPTRTPDTPSHHDAAHLVRYSAVAVAALLGLAWMIRRRIRDAVAGH
jgi:hypothetical protein